MRPAPAAPPPAARVSAAAMLLGDSFRGGACRIRPGCSGIGVPAARQSRLLRRSWPRAVTAGGTGARCERWSTPLRGDVPVTPRCGRSGRLSARWRRRDVKPKSAGRRWWQLRSHSERRSVAVRCPGRDRTRTERLHEPPSLHRALCPAVGCPVPGAVPRTPVPLLRASPGGRLRMSPFPPLRSRLRWALPAVPQQRRPVPWHSHAPAGRPLRTPGSRACHRVRQSRREGIFDQAEM